MMKLISGLALCFALALTTPAAAQDPGAQVLYLDLEQGQQVAVIGSLVEGGQLAEAQLLLDGSIFNEDDFGYQAAYLQAVIYRQTGQFEQAAVLLRQILAERPEFRLVRLELAQVLAALDQAGGAQFHLNILADAAGNAGEREFFEAAIDAVTPDDRLSFSTFLTIAPSSNLNSGGGQGTVLISGLPFQLGTTPESGIGVTYGGTAIYTIPLQNDRQLYFAGAGQVNEYPGSQFDNQILTGRVGLHMGPVTRRATVEFVTDQRWVDGNSSDSSLGLRLAGRLSLGDGMRVEGEYNYSDRNFRISPDQINQDVELTFRKALNAQFGFSLGVIVEDSATLLDANSYDGLGVEIGAYRGFSNGLLLDATAEYKERRFRAVSVVAGGVREDAITRLRLSALSSQLQYRGFTPRVSLTWTRSASNDVRFDYEAYGAEISLTSSF